ncbi:Tetraspanin-33 [Frankliniella fusca]|uniref:Tetraspanin n=1 Tax=Frankliniella fusca TaxID=407009 RepID=A0AAE1L932_9NEOP|nr:Tetraspanin-33 [Frankliniella fusca]
MTFLVSRLACGNNTLKGVLFVFNFLFVVLGLVASSLGAAMMTTEALYVHGVREALWSFVGVGFSATFVSVLGGLGALLESPCLLVTYTVFMSLITFGQLLVGCALIATSSLAHAAVAAIFYRARAGDELLGYIAARTQMLFECCGSQGPEFWSEGEAQGEGPLLPASCCHGGLVRRCDATSAYTEGCTPHVEAFVHKYGITIGSIGLAISLTQSLGIWISISLTYRLRDLARRMKNL